MIFKKNKYFFTTIITGIIISSLLTGCAKKQTLGESSSSSNNSNEPYKITIMLPTLLGDPTTDDSPVKKKLEEYTNTKITFNWVPNSSYEDKFNITLASGQLPQVLYTASKSASVLSGIKAGGFWEVGSQLKNYKNLSKANENILNNISVDGKVYGIYRSRPYGRNAIVYRKDWAEKVGVTELKTIDDFYNLLKGFTTKDPDGNGKNDTYGMAVTKYSGPFDITLTWFGAANKWGEDKSGQLVPSFTTNEYLECLKFWKKLYDEGLINKDFAVFDSAKWRDLLITGKGGVIVDVADQAERIEEGLLKADPNTTAKLDIVPTVDAGKGLRNLPTSGYAGMFIFPKQAIKDEKELAKVLTFMDKINDKEGQILINNGIEGRQFNLENGYRVANNDNSIQKSENGDLAQLGTAIPQDLSYVIKPTATRDKVQAVIKENDKYCIPNPAEPYASNAYSSNGAQLDNIIETARVKFIVGQTDEAGFKAAIETWKKSGGTDVIKEINEEYSKYKKK
jgi:putative aldouronate transport system substrate-binding protein